MTTQEFDDLILLKVDLFRAKHHLRDALWDSNSFPELQKTIPPMLKTIEKLAGEVVELLAGDLSA